MKISNENLSRANNVVGLVTGLLTLTLVVVQAVTSVRSLIADRKARVNAVKEPADAAKNG